jgi:hypothetical protein
VRPQARVENGPDVRSGIVRAARTRDAELDGSAEDGEPRSGSRPARAPERQLPYDAARARSTWGIVEVSRAAAGVDGADDARLAGGEVNKLQLVLRARAAQDPARFAEHVRDVVVPSLMRREPRGLKVTLTDRRPPRLSLVPFGRAPLALVSIWPQPGDDSLAAWRERVPEGAGVGVGAYRVEESVPLAYARDWPEGEPTPGLGLLTLFRRRRGLSDADFLRRWHEGHTPLALEVHPFWSYLRNVVVAGEPPLDAIVEEHFRAPEDVLDPRRFFGGAGKMLPNLARVGVDIARFIDLASLETYLVTELHVRSPRR